VFNHQQKAYPNIAHHCNYHGYYCVRQSTTCFAFNFYVSDKSKKKWPGSSVGIATCYVLDGPGIEFQCGVEIFRTCPDRPWGPPKLLYNEHRVYSGVRSGKDVTLTPHPLLVPWSRKSRAIPILPLWTVRPVQSLSACTRVHFIFFHYVNDRREKSTRERQIFWGIDTYKQVQKNVDWCCLHR